ncbi:MAG TPA: MoxR family ATPase [Syntrophomonadaceae bacterium]|nr:MoxR family ATPase [Syntrophomonadaceae bacterium]
MGSLETIEFIQRKMYEAGYLCDEQPATVIYLARKLNKPILVEGPPGVGKTSIAQAFALSNNLPLIRLQCYEGIDETRALYEWNYKKQLLHIQAVAHQNLDVAEIEKQIFSDEYLLSRPLLQSITNNEPTCLLIDEIDKVDFEFEAMLLELLSEYQVTVPEFGTIKAHHIPIVFLTSNATRELSESLKRRCLYLYLDFPNPEVEKSILELKVPSLNEKLAFQLIESITNIRKMKLKKQPSIAESIDWAFSLINLGIEELDNNSLIKTLNVLLKHKEDIELVKKTLINQ